MADMQPSHMASEEGLTTNNMMAAGLFKEIDETENRRTKNKEDV